MRYSKIVGLGHHVPETVITNAQLSSMMDTTNEWIIERTGIKERRWIDPTKDTVANMAAKATRMALERAKLTEKDIEFIVFATITPDYFFPGSGVLLQRELGLESIGALDIRNACSGFIYALSVADQFIKTGMYKTILVVGAEIQVFDNHLYKLRRIKHTLGNQFYTSTIDTITLSECLKNADVVIGALRAEKGKARHVVSEEMVKNMRPDSLIIDLSIDQGGCIATSETTSLNRPVFRKYDIIHYCVPNVASRVATTATTALSNIFTPTILRAAEEGGVEEMIFSHKWFMKGVYTYKGTLTNESIARKFAMKFKNIELLLALRM
ncbi:MAG: hypothetical protein HC819_24360 [Cyclobacteriaceae bacterium]|nr:hypothetical protein [Cyclobacteriaceae bacterium]